MNVELTEEQRDIVFDCINNKLCNTEHVLKINNKNSFMDTRELQKYIDKLYEVSEIFQEHPEV